MEKTGSERAASTQAEGEREVHFATLEEEIERALQGGALPWVKKRRVRDIWIRGRRLP